MAKSKIEHHITRFQNNRAYLSKLDPSLPEWAVVVAFYCALHGIQALLVQSGKEPQKHSDRNYELNRLDRMPRFAGKKREIRQLVTEYTTLREASQHARYDTQYTQYTDVDNVQTDIIDGCLTAIEGLLKTLLGSQTAFGNLEPVRLSGYVRAAANHQAGPSLEAH